AGRASRPLTPPAHQQAIQAVPPGTAPQAGDIPLSWQDAVRGLELDDAARRSVARRRASALEYPEPTEATGSKATMTRGGCALTWPVLLLVFLWNWWPPARYLIAPLLILFLGLQLLRYLIPRPRPPRSGEESP